MNIEYRFVQPVDTLTFRGNLSFGDPGSYGVSQFPPRPSVLAGAFRSLLLSRSADEIDQFTRNQRLSNDNLDRVLGTPKAPGSFRITAVRPAIKQATGRIDTLLPLPADLLITNKGRTILRLIPQALSSQIKTCQPIELSFLPVLKQNQQCKAETGWLLTSAGERAYVNDRSIEPKHLLSSEKLWLKESRVGIGMDQNARTAEEGKLFSVEHTVPHQLEHSKIVSGLLVGMAGCDEQLPKTGLIRLGGDGRVAQFGTAPGTESTLPQQIQSQGRFKLTMLTPGLFEQGWLPDNLYRQDGGYYLQLSGLRARLACAAISRNEIVSGWDLANWRPKTARRAVPAGSIYWFDQMEGGLHALGKLAASGLWASSWDNQDKTRWAEGYNQVLVAAWSQNQQETHHV